MTFLAAVVQTATVFGDDSREANLENAWRYAADACQRGAQIVCFPETYPGAWVGPVTWTPLQELRSMARDNGIYVIGGYTEPLDADGWRCHNAVALVAPSGDLVGVYRRTTPAHAPWIYKGGEWWWDFDWVPANDLPVFETELGTIGLLICSEVYAPELARILALKGAEILFLPMGFMGTRAGIRETWRTLMWARAIENLAYTAVSSSILPGDDRGLAMVCSPEEIVLESIAEGVHVAEVDLDRVRWLRAEQDRVVEEPEPWKTKPGTLRDWRRQEVFDANPELARVTSDALAR
jgi:predicted amidohydrolase